ncbi:hypothetical protein [Kitasatospora griseola]|uniref:hypothetical protein n=1 Tax=Kitasatospora griseola TaxID=2064 RepID=UPI00166FD343|nr:hypothetical protein [Kitasatospora griseola]GGR00850.1 hypothetical protein GCM10010195_65860 [Kitasatospora griseola]
MQFTFSAIALLGVIIVLRLRRPTQPRTRFDEKLSAVCCVVFGVLIAATPAGQAILDFVASLTQNIH